MPSGQITLPNGSDPSRGYKLVNEKGGDKIPALSVLFERTAILEEIHIISPRSHSPPPVSMWAVRRVVNRPVNRPQRASLDAAVQMDIVRPVALDADDGFFLVSHHHAIGMIAVWADVLHVG
jgi:hypothetical protein